ncbi:MAG: PDZ domain-containing protein [Ectobacillus sp.]
METWLSEFGTAIGRFFLHPVLYIFVISSLLVGSLRVARERKDFSFKVYDVWYELRTSLFAGFGFGLLLSIITVGAGLVVSQASIMLIALWTVFFALLTQYRYLSAAYSIGTVIFLLLFLPKLQIGIASIDAALADGKETSLPALALLLGLLLLIEGLLITKRAVHASTPRLQKGKRGFNIGLHVCKRLWIVPVFILVPGDGIQELFSWWPVVSVDSKTFSLFLIPFGLGFAKKMKGSLPSQAISYTGRRVIGLSLLVLVLALISLWLPGIALAAAGVAMLGRFTITVREQIEDEQLPPYFSIRKKGLMILDVLPNTPAEQIGLKPGEVITKVNGVEPKSMRDFYEALQRNAAGAFCKLEVVDTNGEPRLLQRALFAGDHHELGILFVHRNYEWDTEAV